MSRVADLLGAYYAAAQLARGNAADIEQRFRDLIEEDAEFRAEAQSTLDGLTEAITKRDHVSRVYRDILRKVLT